MTFDPTWLFLSLIPGSIGLVMLAYGRKQQRWPQMVGGLLLMVDPYFTTTVPTLVGVGAAIGVACWWVVRSGW